MYITMYHDTIDISESCRFLKNLNDLTYIQVSFLSLNHILVPSLSLDFNTTLTQVFFMQFRPLLFLNDICLEKIAIRGDSQFPDSRQPGPE